jgi:hypothetical protein
MKDSSSLSTFASKTLHSSARFTETERRRAPFLLLLTLSLLSSFTSYAWDDDEEFDAPSRSTRNNSSIYSTSTKSLLQNEDLYSPKRLISPQQQYEADRASSIRIPSVQESVDLRDHASKELMAESQRRFEKQEADQERSRAQMAKQQEIYDEMDQEECEMAEFVGGVFKAKFGATTGRNSAITSEGYIFRSGDNFITPRGIYSKDRDIYAGPDGITTQTGNLFFGNNGTTIQAGGAYFTDGRSGYVVGPNCRNTSTWRSR